MSVKKINIYNKRDYITTRKNAKFMHIISFKENTFNVKYNKFIHMLKLMTDDFDFVECVYYRNKKLVVRFKDIKIIHPFIT